MLTKTCHATVELVRCYLSCSSYRNTLLICRVGIDSSLMHIINDVDVALNKRCLMLDADIRIPQGSEG